MNNITLTNKQYALLTSILSEYSSHTCITYRDWVDLNRLLEACGVAPRDFSDDQDYAGVYKEVLFEELREALK